MPREPDAVFAAADAELVSECALVLALVTSATWVPSSGPIAEEVDTLAYPKAFLGSPTPRVLPHAGTSPD